MQFRLLIQRLASLSHREFRACNLRGNALPFSLVDTATALKQAMQAVRDAGIPEELWPTALPLALADLRRENGPSSDPLGGAAPKRPRPARKPARPTNVSAAPRAERVLNSVAAESTFLETVARQTETDVGDLRDVFHIDGGRLQLKVLSKDLGDNDKNKTMTVTALVAGAVFAGSRAASVPFSEIHEICKEMRCYSEKHAAEYVRETKGFGTVGSGRSSALTHKNGWELAFADAVQRVLKKPDDDAGR
jgi:hypothetical protein